MINMYDQAAFAQFTPLTSQEILMPAQMMRERHDRLDEEYAAINDNLQKAAFIAKNDPDENVRNQYTNYASNLNNAKNELMNKGINSTSRRSMLDLRGKFQSDITPMITGYDLKRESINNYNKMLASDPTYIGTNPSNHSVSDYIKNGLQPITQQGYSGSLITKQVSEAAKQLSDRIYNDPKQRELLEGMFGNQYVQLLMDGGINPEDIDKNPILKGMLEEVIDSTGIKNWANEDQLKQAYNFGKQGLYSSIGKTDSQIVSNMDYPFFQKLAMAKAAKSEEAKSEEDSRSIPVPLYGNNTLNTEYSAYIDNLKSNTTDHKKILAESKNYSDYINKTKQKDISGTPLIKTMNKAKNGYGYDELSIQKAFDFKEKYNDLPLEQRQKEIQRILKLANEDSNVDSKDLAAMGLAGYNTAVGYALAKGISSNALLGVGSSAGSGMLAGLIKGGKTTAQGAIIGLAGQLLMGDRKGLNSKGEVEFSQEDFINVLKDMDSYQGAADSMENVRNYYKQKGINKTDEELANVVEKDLRKKSIVTNTPYNFNDASTNEYVKRNAEIRLKNLKDANAIITDKDGKKVNASKWDDSDITLENISKDADYLGIIPSLKEMGNRPVQRFVKTVENDTYYIDLPDKNLNTHFNFFNEINKKLQEPLTENKVFNYNGDKYELMFDIDNNDDSQYSIKFPNGNVYAIEDIVKMNMQSLGQEYIRYNEKKK